MFNGINITDNTPQIMFSFVALSKLFPILGVLYILYKNLMFNSSDVILYTSTPEPKSYTTAERVLTLYAVNTYSALMIYTMYMYAIYTQQVCSIWEGTNLDEDVEPLSELDVGSD